MNKQALPILGILLLALAATSPSRRVASNAVKQEKDMAQADIDIHERGGVRCGPGKAEIVAPGGGD